MKEDYYSIRVYIKQRLIIRKKKKKEKNNLYTLVVQIRQRNKNIFIEIEFLLNSQ